MRSTAVPTRGLVGSRQRPALTSLLCSFRRVSNCSFTCFQYRTSMSAHKDLVRGLPGPAQALPVHLEPWAAPRPRAGRQNTAQNHCSSEGHAHNSDLTCKGRALSPGPPAVGVVSIFKRIWSAGTKPSPCRLYLDPPALAQPPYPPPTHRQPGTTGGSPAAWRHPSSCASVLEPPPRRGARRKAYLGARAQLGALGQATAPTRSRSNCTREHSPHQAPNGYRAHPHQLRVLQRARPQTPKGGVPLPNYLS